MSIQVSRLAIAALVAAAPLHAFAQSNAALEAKARAIHSRVLVFDAHADVPNDIGVGPHAFGNDSDSQVDLPKLKRGGVGAINLAVFVPSGPRTADAETKARTFDDAKLAAIGQIGKLYGAQAEQAFSAADIERIHKAGKVAILASFLNAYPFGSALDPIDAYYKAGVRTFGFTHAGNDDYADSSRPGQAKPAEEWGGLSPTGVEAVKKLNRLGVVIDISQLTSKGFEQVLAETKAPVIASHSGARAIVDNARNLSDKELDAIKVNGGVVHVVAFNAYINPQPKDYAQRVAAIRTTYGLAPEFHAAADGTDTLPADKRSAYLSAVKAVDPPGTVKDLVDTVDYIAKRIGVDHVGISSDFNHGGGVEGFANEGEALGVTTELVRRGYSEDDIRKIWGGNFLRVFRAVEATSRRLGQTAMLEQSLP